MARGPCSCKERNPWSLIPRVWLPRGFFHRRLSEPFAPLAAGAGSARKRKREAASIATPEAVAAVKAAAAGAHAPVTFAPGSIAAAFGIPADIFAPPPPPPRAVREGGSEGGGGGDDEPGEGGEGGEAAAAAATADDSQPVTFAWYVDEVLEHRLRRGKAGCHEFRVQWRGLRANDRRRKKWHSIDIFKTEGVDGMMPGESSCTLIDAKIGAFMSRHGIE
jgi:hypothetical protein